jgi:hypothetical protein
MQYLFKLLQDDDNDDDDNNNGDNDAVRSEAMGIMLDCLNNTIPLVVTRQKFHQTKRADCQSAHLIQTSQGLLSNESNLLDQQAPYEKWAAITLAWITDDSEVRNSIETRKVNHKKKSKEMFSETEQE